MKVKFNVRGGHGFTYSNPPPKYVLEEQFFEKFEKKLQDSLQSDRRIRRQVTQEAPTAPRSPSVCDYKYAWSEDSATTSATTAHPSKP